MVIAQSPQRKKSFRSPFEYLPSSTKVFENTLIFLRKECTIPPGNKLELFPHFSPQCHVTFFFWFVVVEKISMQLLRKGKKGYFLENNKVDTTENQYTSPTISITNGMHLSKILK